MKKLSANSEFDEPIPASLLDDGGEPELSFEQMAENLTWRLAGLGQVHVYSLPHSTRGRRISRLKTRLGPHCSDFGIGDGMAPTKATCGFIAQLSLGDIRRKMNLTPLKDEQPVGHPI